METKLEKYINYVVDDLVKRTDVDINTKKIIPPFWTLPTIHSSLGVPITMYPSVSDYIKNHYGSRDEEIQIIWDKYKQSIYTLIKK